MGCIMLFDSKKKKQSPVNAQSHMHELCAFVLSVITLFLMLACFSYSPYDRSWFYYASEYDHVHNLCGTVGAYSAATVFYLLGSVAYGLLGLLCMLTYYIARKKSIRNEWERFVAYAVGMAAVAALLQYLNIIVKGCPLTGGVIGIHFFNLCHTFFDTVGSTLLLYTMIIASFFVLTRVSIATLVCAGLNALEATHRFIKKYKIMQHAVVAVKTVSYALYGLSCAWYTAMKSVIDGSAFYDAGYLAPDDDFYFKTMVHDFPQPIQKKQEQEAYVVDQGAENLANVPEVTFVQAASTDNVTDREYAAAHRAYMLPQATLFVSTGNVAEDMQMRQDLELVAQTLEEKLKRFGVSGSVISIKRGPVVTLFEYQPSIDTKLSKIVALEDDLALALQALSIRILAPIPGRSVVGFEVANKQRKDVPLSDIIRSADFQNSAMSLPLVLGQNTVGAQVIVDLVKMPHLLIAGSTGSGKSIALNTMLMSLLCKCTPDELKLILIDPKRLEFASYADIAHLLFPIITDPKKAAPVLRWVVAQMEERYEKMAYKGVRNILDYNKDVVKEEKLPFIVVIIDELADLMMTAGRDIEDLIARITQMARAAGIHMIVATQRPSVDVITGLIKVNFPSRISFRVTSKVDSRTILDCNGADKLLGRGDMLFLDSHNATLRRVHGAYVSDKEIEEVVHHIKMQQTVKYLDIMQEFATLVQDSGEEDDTIFNDVVSFLQEIDDVSISLLQRKFKIGYNRSARIIERLESQGMIMPSEGGKTRKVVR